MATSSTSMDESNKSDREFEVASIERGGGRGAKGRGRSRGRGRGRAKQSRSGSRAELEGSRGRSASRSRGRSASRSRGRSSTRGRRKQQGVIHFEQGDAERIRDLQEDRVNKANNIIDELTEEGAKNILKGVAKSMPSIILDVAEQLSKQQDQPPNQPGSPPEAPQNNDTWPSWCVCQRCREMPTAYSRKCCGMRPELCTSLIPEMDLIITDPHVLALQRLYRNDIFARHATSVEDINKSQRYASYTQFTLFKYGKLGAHDRRAVPSCCTWFIRNKFPDPNGHYIDYVPIWCHGVIYAFVVTKMFNVLKAVM